MDIQTLAIALAMLVPLIVVALLQIQSFFLHVPPVSTQSKVRAAALDLLKGETPKTIAELGSGWGGMAKKLADTYPAAQVTGYEKSILPYLWSRLTVQRPNLKIRYANIFEADLRDTDVVFSYLAPVLMKQLSSKLDAEMKNGACLVTASFPLPEKPPEKQLKVKVIVDIPVYLYRW